MPQENEWALIGAMVETHPNGTWSLCLPSGRYLTGKAVDQAEAKAAARAVLDTFVLEQVTKGQTVGGGVFQFPVR